LSQDSTPPVHPLPKEIPQICTGKISVLPAVTKTLVAAVVPFALKVIKSAVLPEAVVFVNRTPLFFPKVLAAPVFPN